MKSPAVISHSSVNILHFKFIFLKTYQSGFKNNKIHTKIKNKYPTKR